MSPEAVLAPPLAERVLARSPRRTGSALAVWTAFTSVWARRETLWYLTTRNLRAQYKQSLLGYAWLIVNPLTQLATLAFIFSVVFQPSSQGSPFVLFLSIGLFPWMFFANALIQATDSLVGSAGLVTALYFPRHILIVSAVLMRTLDFLVGMAIIFVVVAVEGQPLSLNIFWLFPLFILQFLFIVGLALPLAALNLFFHDIRFLVGVVLNLWFFFTPIFYSPDMVASRYRILYDLNPMARFVGAYREAILSGGGPPAESLLAAGIAAFSVLFVGYYIFRRLEPRFADRI